ncbi:MAG: sel1 repeat family protein, partial [Nitrososphaera sp.]|nr:sel1 repeat family protein [Nitrososphaera sp.]
GVEELLYGSLRQDFYKRVSIYEPDVAFFQEILPRIHLVSRDNRIVARLGERFLEGEWLLVDVRRKIDAPTREASLNGAKTKVNYWCGMSLQRVREWSLGSFGPWKEVASLGEFQMVVVLPGSDRERLINEGKLERAVQKEFGLSPLKQSEVPSAPFVFPLFADLAHLSKEKAVAAVQKLADKGDAEAQFILGVWSERGLFVPVDKEKAIALYQSSANKNYDPAAYHLGELLLEADWVRRNPELAVTFLREAAERGHVASLGKLGSLLITGDGCKQDVREGLLFLDFAAGKGDPFSLTKLSELVRDSTDRNPNSLLSETDLNSFYKQQGKQIPDPWRMLETAAQMHHGQAAFWLGTRLSQGTEAVPRLKWGLLAAKWLRDNPPVSIGFFDLAVGLVEFEVVKFGESEIENAIEEALFQDSFFKPIE